MKDPANQFVIHKSAIPKCLGNMNSDPLLQVNQRAMANHDQKDQGKSILLQSYSVGSITKDEAVLDPADDIDHTELEQHEYEHFQLGNYHKSFP